MIFFFLVENNRMLDEEKWLLIAIFSIKSWGQYCGVCAAKIIIFTSQSYKPAISFLKLACAFLSFRVWKISKYVENKWDYF